MSSITVRELETGLRNVKGASFVGLTTLTEPKMVVKHRDTKAPNPYLGRVKKRSVITGIIGFSYANAVNNQRLRENTDVTADKVEEFVPEPRSWGERDGVLVTHKGKTYLEVKVQNTAKPEYLVDNRPATDAEIDAIKAYEPVKTEGGRQEVERPVILRDYSLDSICQIRYAGAEFTIQ